MFTRNPADLRMFGGDQEKANAILAAIEAGKFEIRRRHNIRLLAIDAGEFGIYTTREYGRGTGYFYDDGLDGNEWAVNISSSRYLIVEPEGEGQLGVFDELEHREGLRQKMKAEAEQDPEGAFGGRGNNVTLGW